ncbi:MAG: LUD domain-containing protein [Terriglobales bacterium]
MNPTLSTPPAPRTDLGRVQRFTLAAQAVAATVECVAPSPEAIAAAVSRIAARANATRIAIAEPRDIPDALFAACRNLPGVVTGRTRRDLATCDIGVTDTFAAVATTGTVCVRVNPGFSGYLSLLVRTHIAVVSPARIVERPGDLFREDCLNGEGLREDFVYITGPSATADMGPLVRGVHGPHFLHILVLSD